MLLTRRSAALALTASLAACGRREPSAADAPPEGSLAWAIAGPWRIDPHRDEWRHPLQTLLFWGLQGDMTVLEVLPGLGWYTSILAPYLKANGGRLIAAGFDANDASVARREVAALWEARFAHDRERFGDIARVSMYADVFAPPNSVDLVILANVAHTLMAEGVLERVLDRCFAALKPGGALGVEQHRAKNSGIQDSPALTGYVQEAYMRSVAQQAGLEFVAASDLNANPRDTRDHPFHVWSLPPDLRTAPLGQPDDPDFDTSPYQAIGESDRMTLKFRKPTGVPAAP
jgi:predicted methyltransferase